MSYLRLLSSLLSYNSGSQQLQCDPLMTFSKFAVTPSNRIDWVTLKESIFRGLFPFTVFLLPSFMMHFTNSSSGSLPTRQVQMFDVAIPLVVELVLSAFCILSPSSSPASFVLVFLLIFFLAFSLQLPFLTVILLLKCVRSTSFVWFLLCV